MAATVILLEATPRRASDGVAQTVRLAGGGADVPYRYGGYDWRAGIDGLPRSVSTLAFDGEQLGGGGTAQALELRWGAATNALLAELAAYYWTDAPVTVRIGPEDATFAVPAVAQSGLVLDTAVEDGRLRIALADAAVDLKRALLTDRFGGTGGVDGPVEWANKIKTRGWGRLFNVPGECIDKVNNIWCFGDPARAWQAFDAVRDEGVPTAAGTLTTLAWAGSVAATFAALQAAAATAGGGVLCPAIACIKWWTQPLGDLHADVRGETAGGYVETAPEIAQRIVAARSTLAFAAGAVAAAAAVRPAPCGWRIASDGAIAADEISALLAGVSLSWTVVAGVIEFRAWDWTASTRAARSVSVSRRSVGKPVAGRKVGYHQNQAPMSRGELAGAVLIGDVLYPDGSGAAAAIAAKSRIFNRATAPTADESIEDDSWQDSANGNLEYKRLPGSGRLAASGVRIVASGAPLLGRPWALANDTRIDASATKLIGIQAGADVTATAQVSIDGPATIVVPASAAGVPTQSTTNHIFKRLLGATDVSASTVWSIAASSGCTVAVAGGTVTRSGTLAPGAGGKFTLRCVRDGLTRDLAVTFVRDDAPPSYSTGGGGGGSNPGTSGSGNVSCTALNNTYGTPGTESAFTCVAGTAGQVALSASVFGSIDRTGTGTVNEYLYGKWQWRAVGGTWADVTTEAQSDYPAQFNFPGDVNGCTIAATPTKAGLTSGTTYQFQFIVRRGSSAPSDVTAYFSGTVGGTGS